MVALPPLPADDSPAPADDSPAPADDSPAPADGSPRPASLPKSPASLRKCPASHSPGNYSTLSDSTATIFQPRRGWIPASRYAHSVSPHRCRVLRRY